MRVTGQMITTNMMSNINRNKVNMNKKGDQYATGQAIQKPSDDPVIAVRTLKYRTQLTKIEQYLESNIPEALSWMEITEEALGGVSDLIRNINTYCNYGVNGYLELTDRNSIITTLEEYKEQLFELGNTDYAGRYVFTGYRTDTPLMFEEATNGTDKESYTTYTITENLKYEDIISKSYIVGGAEYQAGVTNPDTYVAMAPSIEKANKLKLSYGNLDAVTSVTLTDKNGATITVDTTGTTAKDKDGVAVNPAPSYILDRRSIADYENDPANNTNPYEAGPDEIIYIEETGELILGENVMATAVTYYNISTTYSKTEFEKGDILPEHYFACTAQYYKKEGGNAVLKETIHYTEPSVQNIEYEMNNTQKLTVNTLAKDAISSELCTKIDELISAVNVVFNVKDKITKAETTLKTAPENEKEAIKAYIEQLETEKVLAEKILTEHFENGITVTKEAEEKNNVAVADIGARYTRGQLIESRMQEQETTITELLSDIFYVDLEDAIIEFNSAQLYYNASLQCASKITQNSLLDYLR